MLTDLKVAEAHDDAIQPEVPEDLYHPLSWIHNGLHSFHELQKEEA